MEMDVKRHSRVAPSNRGIASFVALSSVTSALAWWAAYHNFDFLCGGLARVALAAVTFPLRYTAAAASSVVFGLISHRCEQKSLGSVDWYHAWIVPVVERWSAVECGG